MNAVARSSTPTTAPAVLRHPFFVVQKLVLSAGLTYKPSERLVALAIAARMNGDGIAFMTPEDIAARTGLTSRTVKKIVVHKLDKLFARTFPGITNTIRHSTAQYRLLRRDLA